MYVMKFVCTPTLVTGVWGELGWIWEGNLVAQGLWETLSQLCEFLLEVSYKRFLGTQNTDLEDEWVVSIYK